MGQIIEKLITDFSEGVSDNARRGLAQMISNFDIFTNPGRLIPYADSESGDNASATSKKQAFEIAFWTPSSGSWRLFSLGVVSGTTRAEILMKTLDTGGSADLSDDTWATPNGNQSASGTTSFKLFRYYKTTGIIYGAKAGTTIWAFYPDGSTAFDDSHHSLSYTNIGQGLVHSKDDCLYIPYDNKIARNNNGSWTDAALTIPASHYIASICEYGNYLAVTMTPLSGVGKSRVYLWDRDSSLATITESIDFGEGSLLVLEELEGYLVGISISSTGRTRPRITFRYSTGGNSAKKFKEFSTVLGSSIGLTALKQKVDNRVFFSMYLTIDSVVRRGIWSIGISSAGQFTITNERTPFNDVTPSGNDEVQGFIVVSDYYFIAYFDASAVIALGKTSDSNLAFASATAILETVAINAGDSDVIKKLIGATLTFEPLSSSPNAKVSLYYKKDSETDWTRIFVFDTDNGISHSAVRLENSTAAFTVTIASPGVFTLTNHGLIAGQKIRLATTGALPTGLDTTTEYYVLSSGLTSSSFKLSLTSGGSAINTTGSQSGTHTVKRDKNLTEGKDFKFRIESIGAYITGLKYKMEVLDKQKF